MYELPGPLSSGKAQLFGLLEQYLSYSKSLPLTIDLHAFGPPGLGTHDALSSGRVTGRFLNTMSGILTLLSIQMYRWREVVVALDQDLLKRFPDVTVIPIPRSLPLLESLSIILDEFDDSVMSDGWYLPLSGDSLGTAPLLRRLFIPHSPVVEELLYFPWSQLTSLTISELKDEFCDVLKPCSMLQSLRILHYSCGTDIPNALDHPYLLPALTRLEICMSNFHSDVVNIPNRLDVFELLTLPSLSTLIITACGVIDLASRPTPEWNHETFEWMMERGSFADTLKTLSISDINISLEKMKELLLLTPSLTHFSYLSSHPKEHHPMPSLIGYINSSLPYLTHLELFLPSRLDNKILKAVCVMLLDSRIEYFKLKVLPDTEGDQLDSMACFEALGRHPGNNYSIIFDK
ncbi:hypothetical protein VKT23_017024 [Stygiomarasmius scandens]|uniref:Uncharacterized protein n=1 Tax=Marasmiellus scandens TaxID=2682957 RepID=A0ABR1IUL0_9AGAR